MTTKAGVWIDHQQAVVVLLADSGPELNKVTFGSDASSVAKGKPKYTPNDFIAEDRRERKSTGELKKGFDQVLALVRGAEALLILGPGEAKGEFAKHIASKKVRGLVVETQTADKLTDKQLTAQVSSHFNSSAGSRPSAPRKKATKKTTKRAVAAAAPKKSAKKSAPKTVKKAVKKTVKKVAKKAKK